MTSEHEIHHPGRFVQKLSSLSARRPCLLYTLMVVSAVMLYVIAYAAYGEIDDGGLGGIGRWTSLTDSEGITDKFDTMEEFMDSAGDTTIETDERSESAIKMFFFYDAQGENVFSEKNLKAIKKFESSILNVNGYEDICVLDSGACSASSLLSPAEYASGSDGNLLSGSALETQLRTILDDAVYSAYTALFINSADFKLGSGDVDTYGTFTRSLLSFGLPYRTGNDVVSVSRDYTNQDDEFDEQIEYFTDFWSENEFFDKSGSALPDSDIMVYHFNSPGISDTELVAYVQQDMLLVISASFLVALVLIASTSSIFVALSSLFTVLLSFFPAYFLFRVVIQEEVVPVLDQLTIFVTLAIGCDNSLVTHSFFLQSELEADNLVDIIALTIDRSFAAISVTNLTTFVAFVATGISPIPAMSSFGIFAACMVLSNFCLTQVGIPCVLSGWIKLYRYRATISRVPGFKWLGATPRAVVVMSKEDSTVVVAMPSDSTDATATSDSIGPVSPKKPLDTEKGGKIPDEHGCVLHEIMEERRAVDRFFYSSMSPFLLKYRYPILAIVGVVTIVGAVFTAQLSPPESFDPTLPTGSSYLEAYTLSEDFVASSEGDVRQTFFVFPSDLVIDRTGVDRNRMTETGVVNIPTEPLVKTEAQQTAMVEACEKVRSQTDFVVADGTSSYGQADCPVVALKEWRESNSETFPIAEDDFGSVMSTFVAGDGKLHSDRVAFNSNGDVAAIIQRFNTTIPISFMSKELMRGHYEDWQSLLSQSNDITRPQGFEAYQTNDLYVAMITIEALISSAVVSIIISIALAFVVVLLATKNILLSVQTIFTIAVIVSTTMGAFYAIGWEFDVILSICSSIVAGLSIDYCLHIVVSYKESMLAPRYGRTRAAYSELGGSVSMGFVTTALATLILLFAKFAFFRRLGSSIFTAVLVAYIMSVFLLGPLLITVGPEGKQGTWESIFGSKTSKDEASTTAEPEAAEKEMKEVEANAADDTSVKAEAEVAVSSDEEPVSPPVPIGEEGDSDFSDASSVRSSVDDE